MPRGRRKKVQDPDVPDFPLAPSVEFHALIKWEGDRPVLVKDPVRMSDDPAVKLQEAIELALDLPYDGPDPAKQGLSMGMAMVIENARQAAEGDGAAFQRILDRIVGRPVQTVRNLSIKTDLGTLLDRISEEEGIIEHTITLPERENPDMEDL